MSKPVQATPKAAMAASTTKATRETSSKVPVAPSVAPFAPSEAPRIEELTPTEAGEEDTDAPKQRRRPRKLNRPPKLAQKAQEPDAAPAVEDAPPTTPTPINTELETLKGKVGELERQVEELYQKLSSANLKSPRRRGRGRRASGQAATPAEEKEEKEILDLQKQIADAEFELASIKGEETLSLLQDKIQERNQRQTGEAKPRPKPQKLAPLPPNANRARGRPAASRRAYSDEEFIEEIPRAGGPNVGAVPDSNGKVVTLSGSYRVPLPDGVTMDDVKKIQSGLTSASALARNLGQAYRASRPAQPVAAESADGSKQSWSEWFGGYSLAIERAVQSLDTEVAVESAAAPVRTPAARRSAAATNFRSTSLDGGVSLKQLTPGTSADSQKQVARRPQTGAAAARTRRPPIRQAGGGGGLSSEQVEQLMA